VNKALPQFIVGSEHILKAWMVPLFQHQQSDNIFFLRRKSAWLSTQSVVNLVKAVSVALQPFMDRFRFILMMDAAPVHIPRRVVQACTRASLHFMCIPASMTADLQPLDTHVFAAYKLYILHASESALINSASGEISTFTVLEIMVLAIKDVIQGRSWRQAFLQNGFGNQQQDVSDSLRQRLGLREMPILQAHLPTLEELNAIYPRRHEPPVDCLFDLFLPLPNRRRVLPLSFNRPTRRVTTIDPWRGRLRSSSRLVLDEEHVLEVPELAPALTALAAPGHPDSQCGENSQASTLPSTREVPRARRLFPRRPPLVAARSLE